MEDDRFTVHDDKSAQWVLRKLATIQSRKTQVKEVADAEIQRVREWEQAELEKLVPRENTFRVMLEPWVLRQRDEGRKTISLPAGVIKTIATKGRPRVEDREAFVKWAEKAHPDLVRVKVEPDTTKLAQVAVGAGEAVVTNDGEVVPGVEWIPERVNMVITANESMEEVK